MQREQKSVHRPAKWPFTLRAAFQASECSQTVRLVLPKLLTNKNTSRTAWDEFSLRFVLGFSNRTSFQLQLLGQTNWTKLNWPAPSWPSYATRYWSRAWASRSWLAARLQRAHLSSVTRFSSVRVLWTRLRLVTFSNFSQRQIRWSGLSKFYLLKPWNDVVRLAEMWRLKRVCMMYYVLLYGIWA